MDNIKNPRNAGRKRLPADEKMVSIKVSLSPKMADKMYKIIDSEGYASVADYIREVLRKDFNARSNNE